MGTVSISGKTFEIYGEKAAAITYLLARLDAAAWTTASGANKDRALVSATRMLDRQNWIGQKDVDSQALEFPRTDLVDKDGNAVDNVVVPLLVEEANYELALSILKDASTQDRATTGSNVKGVAAGSAKVQFFRPMSGTKLPTVAHEMVGLWLEGSDPSGNAAFGTGGASTFDDIDQWGRVIGFP